MKALAGFYRETPKIAQGLPADHPQGPIWSLGHGFSGDLPVAPTDTAHVPEKEFLDSYPAKYI
jgi:hypothetical protein